MSGVQGLGLGDLGMVAQSRYHLKTSEPNVGVIYRRGSPALRQPYQKGRNGKKIEVE